MQREGSKLRDWFKSTKSCSNGHCVEVQFTDVTILVRDSKKPEQEALEFTLEEWNAFLDGVEKGEFKFSK